MRKREIVNDIYKLRKAKSAYVTALDELYDYCPRFSKCADIARVRCYAYHVMPVAFIGSVFSEYEEEFRSCCEWISDERYMYEAWETDFWPYMKEKRNILVEQKKNLEGGEYDSSYFQFGYSDTLREGELPRAYGNMVYQHCKNAIKCDAGWVFIIGDPYGEYCTKPQKMEDEKAKALVGKIVLSIMTTEYDLPFKEEDFLSFWNNAIDENNRIDALYDRMKPIFRTYDGKRYREIRALCFDSGYTYEGHKKEKSAEISMYLRYVRTFSDVVTEEDAIDALNKIESISNRRYGVLCYKRYSPLDLRVVMQDKILYQFMFTNGRLCFSKEKGHNYEGEYCTDENGSVRSATEEDAYYFFFREYVEFQTEVMTQDIHFRHREKMVEPYKNMKKWDEFLPGEINKEIRSMSKRELNKMRETMIPEVEKLYEQCIDRARYADVMHRQAGTTTSYKEDWEWNYDLCYHPEYYTKWKGTFFDTEHDLAHHLLTGVDDCGNKWNLIKGRPLLWHRYCMKNGAKSPFENLDKYSFEWVRRVSRHYLEDDRCVRYIGYCDSASSVDGLATVHLIDTYCDAYFNNIELPPEIVKTSVGRMVCLTCSYSYYEEGEFRMMKYQVLPYTLTEKLGDYKDDELVVTWNINTIDNKLQEVREMKNEKN